MKPERNVRIDRQQNDTDPISLTLRYYSETGVLTLVDDAHTATLEIQTPAGEVVLEGMAKGDASGTFRFPVGTFSAESGNFPFAAKFHDGNSLQTAGTGVIVQAADVQ